jgi:hypothetical protein
MDSKQRTRQMRDALKEVIKLPDKPKSRLGLEYTHTIIEWLYIHTDLQKQRIALLLDMSGTAVGKITKHLPDVPNPKTGGVFNRSQQSLTDAQFNDLLLVIRQLNQQYKKETT